jgi:micrococcal nuclease
MIKKNEELKMYQYKIKKIKRIIDGDTVDVEIDLGFGITLSQRVRLKGIDAAETRTKDLTEKAEGLAAKEWLEKELSKPGEWIIETTKDDKYGRILGTLYLVGEPVTVNERMVNDGIAKPYMV